MELIRKFEHRENWVYTQQSGVREKGDIEGINRVSIWIKRVYEGTIHNNIKINEYRRIQEIFHYPHSTPMKDSSRKRQYQSAYQFSRC